MNTEFSTHRLTQKDVAKKLGLTQATVSLALRSDPRIPEARRIEIQKAAEAMGYQPSPAGSALAQLRHNSSVRPRQAALAWLNFWRESSKLRELTEFNRYFEGASQTAEKFGFYLEEFRCGREMSLKRIESILLNRGIEGILLPPHRRDLRLEKFDWNKFSVIKFGRSIAEPHAHIVSADQVHNSILAFHEIKSRGYERIGFVNLDVSHWLFDAGYLKAQICVPEKQRLPILTIPKRIDRLNKDEMENTLKQLDNWIKTEKPDAVFTSSAHLPEMLKTLGYSIPEDIAIAATSLTDCQVSAGIDQNALDIGSAAVLSLISHIHDNDRGIPRHYRETLVKGKWIDGDCLPVKVGKRKKSCQQLPNQKHFRRKTQLIA